MSFARSRLPVVARCLLGSLLVGGMGWAQSSVSDGSYGEGISPERTTFDRPLMPTLTDKALSDSVDRTPVPPRMIRGVIFFPPLPPPLDAAVNRDRAEDNRGSNLQSFNEAPAGLEDFVGEFFYPQLSSRLFDGNPPEKLRRLLATYSEKKRSLLQELRATLAASTDAEPAARRATLTALAQRQAPALAELEKIAETLRDDLIASDRDWSKFRTWKLTKVDEKDPRGFSPSEIAQVMRAAIFYERGLLPAQRRLLKEVVIDLGMAVPVTAETDTPSQLAFFSPSPARITLPEDLPAPLAAKIAEYQTRKSLLKTQLYDALFDADGKSRFFGSPITAIAGKQATPLREIEALAEEIRTELEPLAAMLQPARTSALPPRFMDRLMEIYEQRAAAQNEATQALKAIMERVAAEGLAVLISYNFAAGTLHTRAAMLPGRGGNVSGDQLQGLRTELDAVAERYQENITALINRRQELRREVAATYSLSEPQQIDRALLMALRSAVVKKDEAAYREYRTAVLQPGLSVEQRCLLFDAAIVALKLPLPGGEQQPSRRGRSW